MKGNWDKAYKTFSKNPFTANLTHFGKGQKCLNEAHDQKSQNLASSALLCKNAISNFEIAHKNHPNSSDIKETLTKARKEYEEVLKELYLSERGHLTNKESDDPQYFIENKFFKKNYISEKILPLNEDDEPSNTQQLACELCRNDISDGQKKNLCRLAQEIIERFAKRESITLESVHEVMVLSHLPDVEEEIYKNLMERFIYKIKKSILLHQPLLEGLSHIISQANPKHLNPNDLVNILEILNKKFKNLHTQNKDQQIEMTRTLGRLFDVMTDCEVQDLKYEELYKPLYNTFKKLQNSSNQELAYHAKYACQALNCIPNDESPWKAFQRRGGKIILGTTKLAGAVKNIDPGKLPDAFKDLSEGFEGIINMAVELVDLVKEIQSAKEGVNDIKLSFSWEIQREWYRALRFTDLFIQSHKFASLEQFIYKIPCRQNDKFLWGLCVRLEQLAANYNLDIDIRKGAIDFLNNICQNKEFWSTHPKLNEWILEHIELKTLSKSAQTSALSFPTALLSDVLLDKYVRPTQQNDLKKSRRELSTQLNGLKDQFFSDLDDECEEALELYVNPQGTWKVSIIKSSYSGKEMVSENREGDVEEVVNRFLESKDKLTSNGKEALEVAANELVNRFLELKDELTSNGKEISEIDTNKLLNETVIKTVNSFFALENQLTLEDERVINKAANQFLDLKVNKVPELEKTITNKFVYSSKYKEDRIKALINILKKNPKIIKNEDVEFLKIEANKCLNLNDKNGFESAVNKLASKARKILETTVDKIVALKCKKVLMILGIGGTGKSTFSRYLARHLWKEYDQLSPSPSPIPLFIPLARLKNGMFNNDDDFIELYLKEKCKLTPDKFNVLRERKFVFILDGYDEIVERERHFYIQNQFCKWKNAKVIISCRPEYLGSGYQKRFFPKNGEKGFQELTIKTFSEKEIKQYIIKYVQKKGHLLNLSEDTYLQQIKKIPNELISNPILLKITLEVLPRFIKQERTTQVNRIPLYDEFLKMWFDHAQDRLYKIRKTEKEEEAFKNLNINNFSETCLQFGKNFAAKMFVDNNIVVITYNSNWEAFLGNKDVESSLLCFSMPLIRRENQYWFLHKTLRDHLIALAFMESLESPIHATLFKEQSFVLEHGVRQFLTEHISQKAETFKPQLLAFIDASKKNDDVQVASANAITILAQAGVLIDDLNDTNISGADLSNKILNNLQAERAKLDNVNFQNARVKDTNLRSASFQNANLQNANLRSANFHNARLQNADLQSSTHRDANFQNANLQNANFRGLYLQNIHFEDADLSYADLQNTIIQDVNFKNVRFKYTNFEDADLSYADLQNTIIQDVNFKNAKLKYTNFQKANLHGSSLQNAHLKGADLSFADLRDTILQYTNFENAKLKNINLRGLSLQNTYFEGADLSFADLRNTILQDVNFRRANLRNVNLRNACIKGADFIFTDLQNTILVDISFQELKEIRNGRRPKIIREIPKLLLDLMNECLVAEPQKRPSTKDLVDKLKQYRQDLTDEDKFLYKQIKEIDNLSANNQHKSEELKYETDKKATTKSQKLSKLSNTVNTGNLIFISKKTEPEYTVIKRFFKKNY
ncbi:10996_t:CDS:2, partial [Cetraspora pellucida]